MGKDVQRSLSETVREGPVSLALGEAPSVMPGLVFSMCALNVVTDSMLTKAVSTSDTGE